MPKLFRCLEKGFFEQLKDKNNHLNWILRFEKKNRKTFIVEIRKNYLDLYFLGHAITITHSNHGHIMTASNAFKPSIKETINIIRNHGKGEWKINLNNIDNYNMFEIIMLEILNRIVHHKKGHISEGISEINHYVDNRIITDKGVLIIDRQIVYPGIKESRLDLLGLKIMPNMNKFSFVIVELKNKENQDISEVFLQIKRYIDLLFEAKDKDGSLVYDNFKATYENMLNQKKELGLLHKTSITQIASKEEISKSDILGLAILDNYNVRSDLLKRAVNNWEKMKDDYNMKLFLKTNVLHQLFFSGLKEAREIIKGLYP